MSSNLSLDEMWQVIEDYGIDRKLLEITQPSDELLFRLYVSIKQVKEKSDLFEKESRDFLKSDPME
ncbi:MAG: hypothetical protein ACREA7_05645 [Nitrosotalea sp.]